MQKGDNMKILLEENPNQKELEVFIRYASMNQGITQLKNMIQTWDKTILCNSEEGKIFISSSNIYYIESVDKHTFVYCSDSVFPCELRLYQLLKELSDFGFVQISKSCILNLNVLESIRPLINSRMEACLSNGEKVKVTRKYVAIMKEKLQTG